MQPMLWPSLHSIADLDLTLQPLCDKEWWRRSRVRGSHVFGAPVQNRALCVPLSKTAALS
jgi:hypothetical protein